MKQRVVLNKVQCRFILLLLVVAVVLAISGHVRMNNLEAENRRLEDLLDKAWAITHAQSEMLNVVKLEEPYNEGVRPGEIDKDEFELLVRLVIAEAGSQPIEGQEAVAQCVMDRLECETYDWGSTVEEVIYRPNQFAVPYDGELTNYPEAVDAVYTVYVKGEKPIKGEVIYFFNPETSDKFAMQSIRNRSTYLATIGNHEFRGEAK